MEVNTTDQASTSTAIPQANVEIHAEGDAINQIHETGSTSSQIQVNVKIVWSPGSRKYYVPISEPSLKPYVGQKIPDLETGIEFYRRYAANCGFDIRLGTSRRARDNTIKKKYVFCSREGEKYTTPAGKSSDTQAQKSTTSLSDDVQSEMSPINKSNDIPVEKSKRNRPTTRVGCEAPA
ncbi:hypothetical protein CASFOL_042213 [Castilleja foliolosa]|uniref:FAR1 domain-containing protein n=1 Tax=Castilleja foliolosa TaxID=1961234 RepID=A0ABD3BA50_9LAMI